MPVPVDRDGLIVEEGRKAQPHARMAYVTPSNQFPLGVAMSRTRRLELLDWAAQENAWIVEDEYDAEYRYFGRPVPSLQSMDRSGCVIYAGTFTKMLFNSLRLGFLRTAGLGSRANAWIIEDEYDAEYRYFGRPVPSLQSMDRSRCVLYVGTFTKMFFNSLRLGFLVVPERIVDAFAAARTMLDRHPPTLEQAILADFILDGHFGHHVRRMRQMYARRMAVLCDASHERLSGTLDVAGADSGMRTLGWIRTGERDADLAARARLRGLEVAALSDFTILHSQPDALILGFAGCPAAELKRGVEVLAGTLQTRHGEPDYRVETPLTAKG